MGAGASCDAPIPVTNAAVMRLRKAIVIRSYNLRKGSSNNKDGAALHAPIITNSMTLDDQFRKYTCRGPDNALYITVRELRRCLDMESDEYIWIEQLLEHLFNGQVRN